MKDVACELVFDVARPATLVLRIAASRSGPPVEDRVEATLDGQPLPLDVIECDHDALAHVVRSEAGELRIAYTAAVGDPPAGAPTATAGLDHEQLVYLRPSRFCPSDRLRGIAAYELGDIPPGPDLVHAVSAWVGSRLSYEGGASGPLDTALDSLLVGRGVCRDFAHLAITMLRALEVPARFVSVYAPGLTPMDFHAVAEAHVDGVWRVVDPARMAPRQSMVRVATGRDAADTAFVTVFGGAADLEETTVTAVVRGDLPNDDHLDLLSLA